MEGRESGQNHHSRSIYDIMNPHGHSSSLHASSLPHESLQYPMHTPHGIQHMYPFGGRWSGFSPGSGTNSSEISTSPGGTSRSNPTKHGSSSHPLSTVASTGTSQSWWGTPPLYPGISNSDLHSFSSVPWNAHEHHEPLSSTRESHGSPYHSSHMRMSNGMLSSSRHSHSYHRPHGSQFQGGTLIHFPHTSSHQQTSSKTEQQQISSTGDSSSQLVSSTMSELPQYHKDKTEKMINNDPLLIAATEVKDKVQSKSSLSGHSNDLMKEKDLLKNISLYGTGVEMSSLHEAEMIKHKQNIQLSDKDNSNMFKASVKEKSALESDFMFDRSKHFMPSVPQVMTARKNDQDRKPTHDVHDTKCNKYDSYYRGPDQDSTTKITSTQDDPQAKRSYLTEDKNYASYPYSVSAELGKTQSNHGITSSKSFQPGTDKNLSKHETFHMHVPNPTSPPERQSTSSSLHNERIARAKATQDWVNQHPALYTSSPEHLLKHEHRAKFPDQEPTYDRHFERKPDCLPSSAYPQSPAKSGSAKNVSRVEKPSKKEYHYESPLNSSLPRYTTFSKVSKPDSPKVQPPKSQETHQSHAPRSQHNKHPFNVDFLSVSADSEKKNESDEFGYKADYMKPSDRVSVIKTMPMIPGLKKDVPDPLINQHVRSEISSPRNEMFEVSRMKKPASLLDSPLPPKKNTAMTHRDMQGSSQVESSSRSSDNGSSSSEEDSEEDEEDDDEHVNETSRNQPNGTGNNEDTEDGSEEASENGSQGDNSSSGSDSDENDSQSQSTQDHEPSDNTSLPESTPEKRKGSFGQGREPKRRKVVDENLLRSPLDSGWKRQIRIRPTGNGDSIRGDVYYFAPCGKKIRTYPEVTKYLEKHGIHDLNLENFSFSTKTTVGEFLEAKQGSKFVRLTEEEVLRRHELEKERQMLRYEKMSKKREKKKLKNELSRRAQEAKNRKKLEKQVAVEEAKILKQQSLKAIADQKRRKKENEKQHREMERLQKQEQIRLEKEMRARSIQQARRNKKEALQHAKMEEAMRKARERELKRQQTVILKQQEKERRKQHLMMIRALESQRKAEERERKKEEKRLEKTLLKQRKMEQRRYERSVARELKKPVDDMVINDGKPLPDYERLKGLNIPGNAYADLLMVEEFVYCFGHVLDIDPESDFPGMADLQAALLNESSNDDALFAACESLLSVALHDPGVVTTTKLGVNVQNIELNEGNISEVLRLFILASNEQKPHELADLLTDKPIHSLSPVKKAAILAFLVNELLCSDKIYNEMENCLEHMSNLRRDKWNMEGRIRKLKADLKVKKTEEGIQKEHEDKPNGNKAKPKTSVKKIASIDDEASNASMMKDDDDDDEEDDDDEDEDDKDDEDKDSDDEDGDDDDAGEDDQDEEDSDDTDDETEPTTVDEIEKRIGRLEKKHSKYRHKLFTASHTLRGLSLGQDRYKRRYHILPHAGGVFIEGMESSEIPDVPSLKNENAEDEKMKGRERANSENYNSDPNATPTEENKKLFPGFPSPIAVPNNVDNSVIKSPILRSPGIKSPSDHINAMNNILHRDNLNIGSSEKHGLLSPTRHTGMVSPTALKLNSPMKWFSLFPHKACDETSLTRSSIVMPSVNKTKPIVPPNVRLLSQDRQFMNSLSNRQGAVDRFGLPGHTGHAQDNSSTHNLMGKAKNPSHHDSKIQGMPGYANFSSTGWPSSDLDIQKLIEHDPQKAAILLDIQSMEPAPIPEDKRYGWWRISDPNMVHKLLKTLNTRGIREKMLHKSLTRHTDYACSSCKKEKEAFHIENQEEEETKDSEILKSPKKEKHRCMKPLPPGKIEDKCFPQVAFSMDKDLLMEVEELEEKMFSASLQNKTWRLSQKASSNVSYIKKESKLKSEEKPLELAKARILSLERGIERRYLKPPFRLEKHPNQAHVSKSNGDSSQTAADGQPQSSDKDWRITPSLLLWRETVESCTSSAQLSMCISMLKDCIAWERSIMKVFCIECRKGDNEELLLLCDQCDRGCHTYCCNPKLERIPDGDWFCRECIMIASGSDQCYGCQGSTGRRLKCEFCPRYYHLQCVDPPLQKTPRSPWACPVCKKARQKSKRPPKRKKRPEDEFETLSAFEKFDIPSKSSRSKKEKMNNRKQAMKHMSPCRQMLAEMERHECSWPFLVPVNGKQFPEYYQIIKNPMDFHTMKVKLRDFQYESREEFASDARLVFRNCDIFNEDDSEVGQAGKRMLKFFEKRWVDILKNEAYDKKPNRSADMGDESDDSEHDDDEDEDEDEDEDDADDDRNETSEVESDSAD